ncbi:MAG: histidine kinase [Mobiluncus porci]|uniref:histidine kinase n=1 Tax=Mobiluncus porci TaxID=2652278 RepID=A0A7K0K6M0_9ACTO|nr:MULTISPECIES: histidine kinase [Mobiluncus]MCI6584984.1 histidine kinase [Mobiluncus sp.]MDD7542116.1 histidine kinase [Mobiluncus porci]MDY5747769.1 histidine kinase [Mobiluncus porci]MST50690.1 two-component sensor histidine kinase [Mobiluncus porci]
MKKTTESPQSSGQVPTSERARTSEPTRTPVRVLVTNLLLAVTLIVLLGVGVLVVVQVGFLETDHAAAARGMLVLVISLLLVVAVLLLRIAQMGRERVDELTLRNKQLELEREQSEQIAVADERARIAREMHDIVAHSLTVIIAMSDGATAALDKNPELAKEALKTMGETGRTALNDTRRLVGVLRAPSEVPKNLDSSVSEAPEASSLEEVRFTPSPDLGEIDGLIEQFRAAGLPITYEMTGGEVPADGPLQLTIFRIVQESLTNILRHAPSSTAVKVTLEVAPDGIEISVFNATSLAGINPGGGKGLVGMRERAAVYEGHVDAGPTPGGWRVEASLHWPAAAKDSDTWVMPS